MGKIDEKNLENAAGGYNAFTNERKFTGKALYLTLQEFQALKNAGIIIEKNSKPILESGKFEEAQKYLDSHGFEGIVDSQQDESSSVIVNILK